MMLSAACISLSQLEGVSLKSPQHRFGRDGRTTGCLMSHCRLHLPGQHAAAQQSAEVVLHSQGGLSSWTCHSECVRLHVIQ